MPQPLCPNTPRTLQSAIVLLYGGSLVLAHTMSPGALVSFMLYQQSLSSAFQVSGHCPLSCACMHSCGCAYVCLCVCECACECALLPELSGPREQVSCSYVHTLHNYVPFCALLH